MHDLEIDLWSGQGQINMTVESQYNILYLILLVMFVIFVTVY